MKREDISKIFEGATEEQINAVLDINSADIGNARKKLEAERDNYKTQLETAQTALKDFEGVDVKELNGRITSLTADLAAKESEYQAKIAEMEFNAVLDAAISGSNAKNAKSVKALLDIEALKASKNQSEDIAAALGKVKTEADYLFVSEEPIYNPVAPTGTPNPGGKMSLIEAMKYKNEHPDADVSTLI
ncbi:MAG: phage scaffolding protein [Ruminococcus sp.]|nr:phage scaffolding protein [Ruminococcus sp.]